MILLFLILCIYAAASGFKDGILWSLKGADAFTWNEHIVFNVERAAVILAAAAAVVTHLGWWPLVVTVAAFLSAFSFCHNQAYYYSRARIANQGWDFKYTSSTSTAKLEFNYKVRLIMAIAGVAVLVAGLIWLN